MQLDQVQADVEVLEGVQVRRSDFGLGCNAADPVLEKASERPFPLLP